MNYYQWRTYGVGDFEINPHPQHLIGEKMTFIRKNLSVERQKKKKLVFGIQKSIWTPTPEF